MAGRYQLPLGRIVHEDLRLHDVVCQCRECLRRYEPFTYARRAVALQHAHSMQVVEAYARELELAIRDQAQAWPALQHALGGIIACIVHGEHYQLELVGSRALEPDCGGYALLDSDFDIVCQLGAVTTQSSEAFIEADIQSFVRSVMEILHDQPSGDFDCIHDEIDGNWTVKFRFARQHRVDLSAHIGPLDPLDTPERGYRLYQCTVARRMAQAKLPTKARHLQRLFVDWAKHCASAACWVPARDWSLGDKLKTVHWWMLASAWWCDRIYLAGPDFHVTQELGQLFVEILRFYATFQWQDFVIVPLCGQYWSHEAEFFAGEARQGTSRPFIPRSDCPLATSDVTKSIVIIDPVPLLQGRWACCCRALSQATLEQMRLKLDVYAKMFADDENPGRLLDYVVARIKQCNR